MPRTIVLDYHGEISELPFARLDREKLYGRKVRLVTDEEGRPCRSAWLSSDGATVVPAGGLAQVYLDEEGNPVERRELVAVDDEDRPLDVLPSTLGIAHEVAPADPARVLDHLASTVYQLDDDAIGPELSAALDRGEIVETEFRYQAGPQTNALFVVRNEAGTFGLVGQPVDFAFVRRASAGEEDDLDDEDDDEGAEGDELDFTML